MFAHAHINELTLGLGLLFGILHALEPGHGKTALFVHLLNGNKSRWIPLVMGIATALSHSVSLLIVAAVIHLLTHMLSGHAIESAAICLLQWGSVALILGIGSWMLIKAFHTSTTTKSCTCSMHKKENKEPSCQEGSTLLGNDFTLSAALGAAVGLMPCPSALVAYLTGLTSGNLLEGYLIIAAFAVGICLSLTVIGLILQCFSSSVGHLLHLSDRSKQLNILRASIIVLVGMFYAGRLLWQPTGNLVQATAFH
ncbi:urease accessory protein UreH domain-containing protein [Calycomorphotria hydatis]|uniref:Nickel/cobalt efflux protein RcnA n=1 Tax=Calycomorphotria hydatis TaxID=2528027 RepID=A0A517TA04_9PLAN|nr:sulfite exporter TauE/SafE family protein [Calycomorphotria hydatis]QDT65204.1 nickel/cobalt efflux protein RcnA [Calycomorphotria hydatis]